MYLDDLKKHYVTWTNMCCELRIGMNAYQYWRKIGYIPFSAQCVIQEKTKGKFKADINHGRPPKNKD